MQPPMKSLYLALILGFSSLAHAGDPQISPHGLTVEKLIEISQGAVSLEGSILAVSESLKGTPYILGNAGEGPQSPYDQDPLWRLDAQDCTTFMETVMAVSLAQDRASFLLRLRQIRYKDGQISYVTRNHFPEVDWLAHNERTGFVHDLTAELFPDLVRHSRLTVDKGFWYAKKTADDIEPKTRPLAERERRAAELRSLANQFSPQDAAVPYLPMQAFYKSGSLEPNPAVLRKIPSGSIFNIVRENWKPGGVAISISHQGFLVQKKDGTYMRHASPNRGVVEDRLDEYFKKFLASPTIRGINIQQVLGQAE